jgi:GNAT superfamily N-acetyltransferase
MIEIAPLRATERADWEVLWEAYQRFYAVTLPAEVTSTTWDRLFSGRVHGLGARGADGRLVGFTHFLYHEDTWSQSPACYLQDLYVAPEMRSGGLGRKLVEAVAAAAHAAGANAPYWLTHESNTVARRLYDRLAKNHGFLQYVFEA